MPALPTANAQDSSSSTTPEIEIREYRIYVTGYGPFLNIVDNPSWLIVSSLNVNKHVLHVPLSPTLHLHIHLIPHPEPLRVAYKEVAHAVKEIYETADFDYILHVGVGLDGGYQLEMVARKEGYTRVDVDGLGPADGDGGKAVGTMGHWAGGGAAKRVTGPSKIIWDKDEMRVGLDVEWICRVVEKGGVKFEDEDEGVDEILDQGGWVELVKRIPPPPGTKTSPKKKKNGAHAADVPNDQPGFITRPSTNAGLFLCEYILRKSLEEAIRRKRSGARRPWDWRKRYGGRVGRGPGGGYVTMEGRETPANVSKRVLFMHVPNVGKPYTIEDGVKELKSVVIRMVLDGEGLSGEGWYD